MRQVVLILTFLSVAALASLAMASPMLLVGALVGVLFGAALVSK